MAITLIGTATTAFGTGGASSAIGTISYPSTIADGDHCFVYLTKNDESPGADATGIQIEGFATTWIWTTFSQDMAAVIGIRKCDGTETGNITITGDANGDDWSAVAFILRGVDPVQPFDNYIGWSQQNNAPDNPAGQWQFDENHQPDAVASVKTLTDDAWVLVGNGSNDDGVTSQTLTGYTEIGSSYDSSTFASQVVFYKEIATAGTESPGTITTNGIDSTTADLYQSTIAIRPETDDSHELSTDAPVIESVAYNTQLALTTTSVDFDYPSGIVAGDEIIAVFATGEDAFLLQSTDDDFEFWRTNVDSPWVQSSTGGDDKQIGVWRRVADGTEGSTFRVKMSTSTVDVMMMVFRISGGVLYAPWRFSSSHWEETNFTDDDPLTQVHAYAPSDNALLFHNIVCVDGFYTEGNAVLTGASGIGTEVLYDDILSGAVHGQMSILSFVGTASDIDTLSDTGTLDMNQSTQAQADLAGMHFWIMPTSASGGAVEDITMHYAQMMS